MGFCCVCGYCTTGLKEEFFLSWNAAVALTGQSIDMQRGRLKLICWKFVLQHTILELTVMKQENWLTILSFRMSQQFWWLLRFQAVPRSRILTVLDSSAGNLLHHNFATLTSCPRSSTELNGSSRNLLSSQKKIDCTPRSSNCEESVNSAGNCDLGGQLLFFGSLTIRTTVPYAVV